MAKYAPAKMIATRLTDDEYATFAAEAQRTGNTPSALVRIVLQKVISNILVRHPAPPKPKGTWPHRRQKAEPQEPAPKEPKSVVYYQFPVSMLDELRDTAKRTGVNPRVLMTQAVRTHLETLNQLED